MGGEVVLNFATTQPGEEAAPRSLRLLFEAERPAHDLAGLLPLLADLVVSHFGQASLNPPS